MVMVSTASRECIAIRLGSLHLCFHLAQAFETCVSHEQLLLRDVLLELLGTGCRSVLECLESTEIVGSSFGTKGEGVAACGGGGAEAVGVAGPLVGGEVGKKKTLGVELLRARPRGNRQCSPCHLLAL